MILNAYACRIIEENYPAIASENPKFDLEILKVWVEINGVGYFVRDEASKKYDCKYMKDEDFHRVFAFDNFSPEAVYHKLLRL